MYICMDDMIMKRAGYKQIAIDTKAITNTVIYTTVGVLIGSGIIGMSIVGNYVVIMGINKVVKGVIKKTGIINKVRKNIREGRIINANR